MVFVKVRETYDLKTVQNKMTVIGIHTPKPDIIKRNFPGLLLQCKAYRPFECNVRIACASMLPSDIQGIGTEPGDVAPEDVFNPILYKATSNFGMSQLEARLNAMAVDPVGTGVDVDGSTAMIDADTFVPSAFTDDFNIYYGLLSNAHDWKKAHPQQGLEMTGLRPLVWELLYNVGDNSQYGARGDQKFSAPNNNGDVSSGGIYAQAIRGNCKQLPFINCTSYTFDSTNDSDRGEQMCGFKHPTMYNAEIEVPYINVMCGVICVPPSRLHSLYYRMVVEWTIEFSQIRPIGEITNFGGVSEIGRTTHYQNYSYEEAKKALTGLDDTILDNDSSMVSANVDINKVM